MTLKLCRGRTQQKCLKQILYRLSTNSSVSVCQHNLCTLSVFHSTRQQHILNRNGQINERTSGSLRTVNSSSQQRCVTTWSPLASVFNSEPREKFSFDFRNEGLFCIPGLTEPLSFHGLYQEAEYMTDKLVAEALSENRDRKMVQVFDDLSDALCRVADMAEFVRVAHPDNTYSMAAAEASLGINYLVEKLNTNVPLYQALKKVHLEGDTVPTDDIDKRVIELFLVDFEKSGIDLDETTREKFVELNEKIINLSNTFTKRTEEPIRVAKVNLPENLQYVFGIDGDNVAVTGMFAHHQSERVREVAHRLYLYRVEHQENILEKLLTTRHELAQLVGFPTFAHRTLQDAIMDKPETVVEFMKSLTEALKPRLKEELKIIQNLKKKDSAAINKEVMPWDLAYYTSQAVTEQSGGYSDAEAACYLSLGSCMDGLDQLFSRLYDINLCHEEAARGELWASDVHKLAVTHKTEGVLGYIYCDLFTRHRKNNQPCHFTIQGGRQLPDGEYQLPKVVLYMNLIPSGSAVPCLLTHSQLENLWHEMGHAMHSMLGRTRYQHVTGTRCSTDFAELPSILMEYFAADPRVISSFACHYKTREAMPSDMVRGIHDSKKAFPALSLQQSIFHSMLDQVYHGEHPLGKSTTDILAELQNNYLGVPYVPGTAWQLRFSHIAGYGARYYSYLLSKALAAKIWQKCFQKDPFNRSMGEQYRQKVLSHGGQRPPLELIQDLIGEEVTPQTFVDTLVEDLDS